MNPTNGTSSGNSSQTANMATTLQDSTTATPWGSWELDENFFGALSRWTLDHPETTLDRVLGNVCNAVDTGKPYLDVIPDSPFPARSLVLGLTHLVKLGKVVSGAKVDVRAFAKDIIKWVSGMKSSFASAGNGRITEEMWRNMAKMRDLIDEICTWAAKRLREGRWSLSNLKIHNEIAKFKTRFTETREVFRDRSFISISGGIDAISRMVFTVVGHLGAIMLILQNVWVMLTRWEATEARHKYLMDTLYPHTVADPTYVQQGKAPCEEGTRMEVLAEIRGWIDDISEGSHNFLWLTGEPGCGKSAITATIAQSCKDANELWAQFFINRNNANTTNPNLYFPSIARQLAIKSTIVEHRIHDALQQQPSLVDRISPEQAAKLFVNAIAAASMTDPEKPVLIVIDGLDETARAHLQATATIFSNLFKALSKYHNAKILISSRAEDEIWKPFTTMMKVEDVNRIHLKTSDPSSIRDVSAYLTKRVRQIARDNHLDPEEWFGTESLAKLTLRASGLFIWAVTVEKLLQSHLKQRGKEGLRSLLDRLDSDKMKDINTLYSTILDFTYNEDADEWVFETFRRVVGAILVLREPLSLAHLGSLLNLRQHPHSDPVDICNLVRQLRTVLVAGTDDVNDITVPQLHKSFVDFITGRSADSRFRIDLEVSNSEVAVQCLHHLTNAYSAIHAAQIESVSSRIVSLSAHLRYTVRFYGSHFSQWEGTAVGTIIISSEDHTISLPDLHTLLRRSSNEASLGPLRISISKDRSQISTSLDNRTNIWEAGNGFPIVVTPIAVFDGHDDRVFSVSFSPDGRQVVSGSLDNTIRLWDAHTYQPIGSPLKGHTSAVWCVCFSPNGNVIASGSGDRMICIWDTKTGQAIGPPLVGHNARVGSVAFSPDGKYIASGSDDKTIRLWDTETLQLFGVPLTGHTNPVRSVAFSPDGARILSSSHDETIRLWDFHTGQPISPVIKGHLVFVAAFSPGSMHIIASLADKTIRLFDTSNGTLVGEPWVGHNDRAFSVAFSPSGDHVVSGSVDKSVRLWDVRRGQTVVSFNGHRHTVRSVAFSPDGNRIVSGSGDSTVRIWAIPRKFLDHEFQTEFTAFSPSGRLTLSSDSDHVTRLWDADKDDAKGLPLEGEGIVLQFVVFSANELRIAGASSDGTICLWDTSMCSLLGRSPPNSVDSTKPLTFTSDGKSIVSGYINPENPGTVWTVIDRKLVNSPAVSEPLQIHDSTFFNVTETAQTYDGARNGRLRTVRWYPQRESGTGLWAFVNNHIIRAQDDGSVVVVPVNLASVGKK